MYMHSYTALIITFIFNLIKCLISAFFCIISVLLFKCYPSCPTFFKVKVTQLMETLPRSFRSKEDRPLELTQLRGPAHIRVSAPPLRWVGTGQDGSAPDTALAAVRRAAALLTLTRLWASAALCFHFLAERFPFLPHVMLHEIKKLWS